MDYKPGEPYNRNRGISPAMRTTRLVMCTVFIAIIFRMLILYPIEIFSRMKMPFTELEWAIVITGFICIQILMLSMYREIKYGGKK